MTENMIASATVEESNHAREALLKKQFDFLGEDLARRGIMIEDILVKVSNFAVAVPSWGVGTGGTRFARFPGGGEPRDIFDKIEDCAVIQQLTQPHQPYRCTSRGTRLIPEA